jgi:hypothetical protein
MMEMCDPSPFSTCSYRVSLVCLATGTLAALFDLRLAFLPAAFVFGWLQIGGS